jgi:hypothetical protein
MGIRIASTRPLPALAFALAVALTGMATAQDAAAPPPAAAQAPGTSRTATFTQLGIDYPIQLHGIQGDAGVPFSVRSDEVVQSASLHLRYAYSPALIPETSQINVSVNDVLVTSIPTPTADAGKTLERDIVLDPRSITDYNRLNLRLIGHYTRDCEDPDHTSLWANVANDSELTLVTTPLVLANELGSLPLPFFDPRDVRPLELPFVFAGMPDHATLQSAAAVSSWFGSLAGYRGASFPVSLDSLPADGNAVVLAIAGTSPGGLTLPPINGPTLAVMTHPQDPNRKLLLVLGRNAAELQTAATALTIGTATLSGATVTITSFKDVSPRKPYDAPNWIPSDRPVRFGELATERDLNVTGYNPDVVRINLQLPPDLFAWRSDGIPVDLKYRYTPPQAPDQSRLSVDINDAFVAALPLPAAPAPDSLLARWNAKIGSDGSLPRHTTLHLPAYLFSSRSQLRFHYYFDRPQAAACKPQPGNDQVHGAIDADSTIDLSGMPHYIAMPDLAAFGNAGFPFTRTADLSDTAVILPDGTGADDVSNVLALLGRVGGSTGYPALRVSFGEAAQVQQFADKDLLVLGSKRNQPLFTQWEASMPLTSDGRSYQFPVSDWVGRAMHWASGDVRRDDLPTTAQLARNVAPGDIAVMGFESPLAKQRSVVAVMADDAQLGGLFTALASPTLIKTVQGSVALIRAGKVESLAGNSTYYVGKLPPLTWLRWFLSRHPLLLAFSSILLALLAAWLLRAALRPLAARRLRRDTH